MTSEQMDSRKRTQQNGVNDREMNKQRKQTKARTKPRPIKQTPEMTEIIFTRRFLFKRVKQYLSRVEEPYKLTCSLLD